MRDDLNQDPWKQFEGNPMPQQEPNMHRIRFDALVHNIFNTSEGRELLDYLRDTYLLRPVAHYTWPKSVCYFREGQNDFIRNEIFGAIERYNLRRNSNE